MSSTIFMQMKPFADSVCMPSKTIESPASKRLTGGQ